MKNKLFKLFYKVHIYVGLFVALHLLVLTLTGSVLLFKDEIEGSSEQSHPEVEHTSAPLEIESFFQNLLQKYPHERPLAFSVEEEHPQVGQLRLGKDNSKEFRGSRRVYFDLQTGNEISAPQEPNSFMDWMLRLHREFLLGSNGKLYVGFIGLLYAFTLLSGFFIYGSFSKKTQFGEIRRQSPRSFSADLHRFIGMTTFAWGLLIAITGLFLGFSSTLIKIYQYSELQKLSAEYATPASATTTLASLDKVLETAQKALPDASFDYLAFPDTQFSPPGHFLVLMHGNTPWTERLVELVVVNATTGELTQVRTLPWYLKITMLSEPLHFGNYGGLFLKILWLIFSLTSLALPILGLIIWNDRRNKSLTGNSKKTSVRLWNHTWFQKAYRLPTLLLVITATAIIGSFLVPGFANPVFVSLLVVPVYFTVRVLLALKKGNSP